MQRVFCHNCHSAFSVPVTDWAGTCPACHEGFVEVLEQEEDPGIRRRSGFHSSFQLPGGFGTVHVMMGAGPDMAGLGFPGLGSDPGAFHGGHMGPGPNPFELIRALTGGVPVGGHGVFLGGDYNQEAMDRVVTEIMNQYQPQSRQTARRVREHLPRLQVRPRRAPVEDAIEPAAASAAPAAGGDDAEMGMAAVCEDEPCSVCHEEFKCGEEVVELPCNHCYHEGCVMPWLESHNTCPVCRWELPVEGERSGSSSRQTSRREQLQARGGSASRASSSRRQQDAGQQGGGGLAGGLNQLLHSIADRWEASHADQSSGDPSAAAGPGPQPSASRQPSSSGGRDGALPVPSREPSAAARLSAPPEPPRVAAGRAAAARAAAAAVAGGSSSEQQGGSGGSFTSAAPAQAAAVGGQPPSQEQQQQADGGVPALAAVGRAFTALVGSAVSAFMNRNQGTQQ